MAGTKTNKSSSKQRYDYVIIGAGMFGLYAAQQLSKRKGKKIAVIERDLESFSRASYINQARVHNGYHYPRSKETADVTSRYYNRFTSDFSFAINSSFKQIYAVASRNSLVSPEDFESFCKEVGIPLREVSSAEYFLDGAVQTAYETTETSFDYAKIRNYFLSEITSTAAVDFFYGRIITSIDHDNKVYRLTLHDGKVVESPFILNVSYSGINQILKMAGLDTFPIKYEMCEMAIAKPSKKLQSLGITVMDGLFFSTMPFADGTVHSLSSVRHTPHKVSYDELPTYVCQNMNSECEPIALANCNPCPFRPVSAWNEMKGLFERFIKPEYSLEYIESLFSIKPILLSSETDDSRPTCIVEAKNSPKFVSVLSGKISSVFELDNILT